MGTPVFLLVTRAILKLTGFVIDRVFSLEVHEFHSDLVISARRTVSFRSVEALMLTSKGSECLIIFIKVQKEKFTWG
jgi:hypothetical protein